MTDDKIRQWERDHRSTYIDLAEHCGSIPELLLKVEIYGRRWTKWDWVLFFKYLAYTSDQFQKGPRPFAPLLGHGKAREEKIPEENLLDDIFDTLDNGTALDNVFTDKTVVMNFVSLIERFERDCDANSALDGVSAFAVCAYSLLAHVFKKFPALWTMNWMFFRPRSGPFRGLRVHRLAGAVNLRRRPDYFASRAFLDDFICKYYRRPSGAV